ncbi:uncharacterized protein FTOL_00361 [Fusarium torulosum]|uniref:Extracellular membrane protein CFEM domain-containing protein n=1 Tax=Fusarium torulosum TaxID=33205 RepID=A0AAE8SC59_9HYPO|nr:uncharacterized protein FTOL_00361 [Fusarium torulosum]
MTRLTLLPLAVLLFSTAVQTANPVFGAYSTDSCDSCLDETYQSCPGDYKTRPYATCMCAGDGSANFVKCLSYCDVNKNEPAIASSTYYGYCVLFFKELCDGAQQFLTEKIYNEQCSKEAIAAGGIGAKDGDNGGDDSSKSESSEPNKTKDSDSEKTGEASETSQTGDASKTAGKSEATHTANDAIASSVPVWAVAAGLGLQFMNM